MTTWANIEVGPKRGADAPIDPSRQSSDRTSGTVSGSYVALVDNSAGVGAVVAHVLTQQNAQFAVSVGSPADDTRSYVVLANAKDAFIVPAGSKLFFRDLT